jgi:antitoxin component of RelBE/YafQ-DinJ toxin-antitoxin module
VSPLKLTTFRIDDGMMAELQAIRDEVGIPVSEQVRRALQAWIDAHKKKGAKRRK